MIEISQEEFERKIEQVIKGENTRTKLIKDLKIDRVTLNRKIQELLVYNPNLYHEFISKFPYMPREYTHINWRAMLIDIMKKGYTKNEAEEQYEVSSRTISRKVYEVEKEDKDIVSLYREVSKYRKRKEKLPFQLQEAVDDLPDEIIFIGGIYDKKVEELIELEKKYNDELLKGEGATTASANCGRKRVSKDLDTLYRIKIETRKAIQKLEMKQHNKEEMEEGEER